MLARWPRRARFTEEERGERCVCVCLCGRCRVTTLVASCVESRVSLTVGESTAFSPAANNWFSSWFAIFNYYVVDGAMLVCLFFSRFLLCQFPRHRDLLRCRSIVGVSCCAAYVERPSRRREHCGGQVLKLERPGLSMMLLRSQSLDNIETARDSMKDMGSIDPGGPGSSDVAVASAAFIIKMSDKSDN